MDTLVTAVLVGLILGLAFSLLTSIIEFGVSKKVKIRLFEDVWYEGVLCHNRGDIVEAAKLGEECYILTFSSGKRHFLNTDQAEEVS